MNKEDMSANNNTQTLAETTSELCSLHSLLNAAIMKEVEVSQQLNDLRRERDKIAASYGVVFARLIRIAGREMPSSVRDYLPDEFKPKGVAER
jgi:uncharacterized membrane protein